MTQLSINPSEDYNLLPLDMWREVIGYNPWHFWGMANAKAPVTSNCNSCVKKYSWQLGGIAGAGGRQDIISSIKTAESRVFPHLGFEIAPRHKEVVMAWPRYPKEDIFRLGYSGADRRWEPIVLPEGYIQHVGVLKRDYIGEVSLVFSDTDSDGLKETFTGTIATTVTNPEEIAAYFIAGDRLNGEDVNENWRILPLQVKISGGIATITGRSWLLVKPALYEGVSINSALDPDAPTTLVSKLDIYRRYTYTEGTTIDDAQAVLVWETPPYPTWAYCCGNSQAGLDPAAVAYGIARVGIRDSVNGIVTVSEAVYNAGTGEWTSIPWFASGVMCRPPDRVIIRYEAGYPLERNGRVNWSMAQTVARLATAELPQQICACQGTNAPLHNWQFDLARSSGNNDEAYSYISREDLSNPFGTRRGQVYAWKEVKSHRRLQGFSI